MDMRAIVSVIFLLACESSPKPTRVAVQPLPSITASASSVAAPPPPPPSPWPDARRIDSADRSFSLLYPARTFTKTEAKGDAITLFSNVSEPSWGQAHGPDIVFGIRLAKIHGTPFAEMQKTLSKETMRTIAPDGTEASFKPSEDFVDKYKNGYVIRMGVEGTGEVIHLFTTKDGSSWRFDCNYCCGMIEHPKMTSDEQFKVCDEVLGAFQREH